MHEAMAEEATAKTQTHTHNIIVHGIHVACALSVPLHRSHIYIYSHIHIMLSVEFRLW